MTPSKAHHWRGGGVVGDAVPAQIRPGHRLDRRALQGDQVLAMKAVRGWAGLLGWVGWAVGLGWLAAGGVWLGVVWVGAVVEWLRHHEMKTLE